MKSAIVTGDTSGIGKAVAIKLLEKGWNVFGISRQLNKEPVKHERMFSKVIDLSQLSSLPEQLKELLQQIPSVDAIISNAGQGKFGHLEQFSFKQIQSLLNLNFLSHVFLVKTFLPLMKRSKKGDIIFIGSEAAIEGKKKGSIYCASKFALRGFAQALREECTHSNIRVCLINPGMVDTPFYNDLGFKPGQESDTHIITEDVAEAALMVLQARQGTVFDELNLSPQKKKILWS